MTKSTTAKAGRPRLARPTRAELKRLYVRGRLSLRETAAALGVSRDTTARILAEYGIPRRPKTARRSQLADIPLAVLKAKVKAEGLRGHARTLGVSAPTLFAYMRRARGGKK